MRRRLALVMALVLTGLSAAAVDGVTGDWTPLRTIEGVPVEFRPTESGFHVHRAQLSVCTELTALEALVRDSTSFEEWVPFTRSARMLESSAGQRIYYVRSSSPWPAKDRDMVYRITRRTLESGELQLELTGLPDYHPLVPDAERIRSAAGAWYLVPEADRVRVSYELYIHPGAAPAYFANRRLATVVGRTLANLAARFPCASS